MAVNRYRITSYNVCYTKLLRVNFQTNATDLGGGTLLVPAATVNAINVNAGVKTTGATLNALAGGITFGGGALEAGAGDCTNSKRRS